MFHPFQRQVMVDKIRGLMVGSALGDAIGLYTEFLSKPMSKAAYPDGRFSLTGNVTPFLNDSHRNKFSEGSWTDDTDHALLILLSFLHSNGEDCDSLDFASRLKFWIEQGLRCLDRLPLGIGRLVGSVVTAKIYLDDPKARAYQYWTNTSFSSAPNGSLMRTHPLGAICMNKSLVETFPIASDFCLVTHADPRCVVSCCIATGIIRAILRGELWREEEHIDWIIEQAASHVETWSERRKSSGPALVELTKNSEESSRSPPALDREELYRHTKAETFSDLQLDDLPKAGYVYKCLGSAILSLRLAMRRLQKITDPRTSASSKGQIFEDIITELTLEGGDADTNGTVAGAFLGCLLGFSSLPAHWYYGLKDIDWLLAKTDAMSRVLGVDECTVGYVGSEDPDTREDGGKPKLNREELEAREKAFMEVYLKKTLNKKTEKAGKSQSSGTGQMLVKTWKNVFG